MANTTFYQTFDNQGRICVRLNRRNGRILARWRCDMPGQTQYQFVRERKAVFDGFGELCYTAIQCALYANGIMSIDAKEHKKGKYLY